MSVRVQIILIWRRRICSDVALSSRISWQLERHQNKEQSGIPIVFVVRLVRFTGRAIAAYKVAGIHPVGSGGRTRTGSLQLLPECHCQARLLPRRCPLLLCRLQSTRLRHLPSCWPVYRPVHVSWILCQVEKNENYYKFRCGLVVKCCSINCGSYYSFSTGKAAGGMYVLKAGENSPSKIKKIFLFHPNVNNS